MMRSILIGLVKGYRLLLSPWLGASCRFEPTCSVYSIEALQTPWRCGGHLPDGSAHCALQPLVQRRARPRAG
jgi:putative component of membrane protein insertase Oxa1/YidC/SpoIIIJ protein YidD